MCADAQGAAGSLLASPPLAKDRHDGIDEVPTSPSSSNSR
jgi:hypothetical protein